MKLARRRLLSLVANQVGLTLPYTFDPSALGDGALPSPWSGDTWTISGGKIINTPSEGTNVLVGGDMETGNPPNGWVAGNATLAADGDAHGGSQSLKVTSTAVAGAAYTNVTVVKDNWYVHSSWAKRTAGQLDLLITPGTYASTGYNIPYHLSPATYTNYRGSVLPNSTTLSVYLRGFDNGSVIYWDDITIKPLTTSQLFATVDARKANVSVKAGLIISNYSPLGVVCNLDSASIPKYYILAVRHARNGIGLFKCINGAITELINTTATYVSGALLEIRKTATNIYQLWYNGVQVGVDQTVTDASLNNNTLHGIFNTGGGSQVNFFFAVAA